ncbi:MAG TPA: YebC/PmpR family DNA-binding transcriptional regulator [Bacteroidetes bacterium]|nr:YebC/PmpR family DNA-binding transcriptional regulator [Bacteroidota bacterium]
MSGHSKWSTIKRKKGALDAKRSKIFSKIVKELQIATREGGPDPSANPRLRLAIQNAKGVNMPKDNIERAISKASSDEANFQEMTFEGYAPHGVGIFIECLTDNKNRTVSNIRSIFTKRGGSLGTNGSLKYVFDRKGVFTIPKGDIDPEEFELELIDAGAEEIEDEGDTLIVTCALEDFGSIQKKLDEMGIQAENAELQRVPVTTKTLGVEEAMKVLKLVEDFEEEDDVQNVYHNLEMTDELMQALEEG